MFCHHRRRVYFIRLVVSIVIIWFCIFVLLNVFKILYGSKFEETADVSLFDSFTKKLFEKKGDAAFVARNFDPLSNLNKEGLPESKSEYRTLKIDAPHFSDAFLDFANLPGFGEPGEWGMPYLEDNLPKEDEALKAAGWALNAFNQLASDRIPLRRRLPDVRQKGCQTELFSLHLPRTSVIVCFHNEAWSTLMRTVHSILDRTDPDLLEEIILVDDFSTMSHLKKDVEDYIAPLGKVKLIRATKREGLIRARLLGASVAKAPVLTFLDSHCECTHGWLEPLLQRIHDNPQAVVAPIIDIIDENSFMFTFITREDFGVGGFNWDLQFDWHLMPEDEKARRMHPWDPIRTPTIAGGLFSISAEYFEKLGKYDEGFDIWGGDNLELSFKTWMCGGTLEIVPCSRVGHVFRSRSPYEWIPGQNVFRRNCVRLAEVWLDDYKQLFYNRIGMDAYNIVEKKQYGDVSSRIELRKKLHCESFDWYLTNIYPELYIPVDLVAEGEVRNLGAGADSCLDAPVMKDDWGKPITMFQCHMNGGNQYFMYTMFGEIKRNTACLDYNTTEIIISECNGSTANQKWIYDPDSHLIKHESSGKCMEMKPTKQGVSLETCDRKSRQLWGLQNFDQTRSVA